MHASSYTTKYVLRVKISDHESRTNSYRAQDDNDQGPVESSPLIHRFPASSIPRQRGPLAAAVISILLLILIAGVIIGIYLLVLQNASGKLPLQRLRKNYAANREVLHAVCLQFKVPHEQKTAANS